jgi:glutamate racemase
LIILQNCENITAQFLLDGMPIIGEALCHIINTSLESGIVPHELKITTIIAVPKVKNSIKCEDFRPINMLPTHEKVLKTVVKQQIKKFAEQQTIFIETQSRF